MKSSKKSKWETVDMTVEEYMATPKDKRYTLMGFNRIGIASVVFEFLDLGHFRLIEWGVYGDWRTLGSGRVSHFQSLEIAEAYFYATTKTLYGRAWGHGIRERAESWGISERVKAEIPLKRGRSYDY